MEGIKYVNLIEIGPMIIEIENSELAVTVKIITHLRATRLS